MRPVGSICIATRYEKTAESYQAAVTLAALLMGA